jgi:hypothetical protein
MWEKGRKDVEVRRDWMKGRNEEGWRFGRNNPPMNFIGPFPLVKIETHFFQSIVECGRSVYQVDSPSSHFHMLEESPFMSAARWTFWALFYWFLSSCSHWVCRGNVTSPSEMCHLGRHLPMPLHACPLNSVASSWRWSVEVQSGVQCVWLELWRLLSVLYVAVD